MGALGVKPARLTLRLRPVVASVIEVPLCNPATRASAFWRPPAQAAKSDAMRPCGAVVSVAAMADEAMASEAASEAASLRWSMGHLLKVPPLCARPGVPAVGAFRECGEPHGAEAVGRLLPAPASAVTECGR